MKNKIFLIILLIGTGIILYSIYYYFSSSDNHKNNFEREETGFTKESFKTNYSNWQTYGFNNGAISIDLPTQPEVVSNDYTTVNWIEKNENPLQIYYETNKSCLEDKKTCYYIEFQRTKEYSQFLDSNYILEDSKKSSLNTYKAALISTENIEYKGYPGIYYISKYNEQDPSYLHTKLFLIEGDLYYLIINSVSKLEPEYKDIFFNSFKFNPNFEATSQFVYKTNGDFELACPNRPIEIIPSPEAQLINEKFNPDEFNDNYSFNLMGGWNEKLMDVTGDGQVEEIKTAWTAMNHGPHELRIIKNGVVIFKNEAANIGAIESPDKKGFLLINVIDWNEATFKITKYIYSDEKFIPDWYQEYCKRNE